MGIFSRSLRIGLLTLAAATIVVAMAGCSSGTSPERASAQAASSEASGAQSAESTAMATAAEAGALLNNFSQPEEAGDLGYPSLGADHNDVAAWTRQVVLAHTDYGRVVHSLAANQSDVATAALADFDDRLASKGASATFDAVLGAEWRLEDTVTVEDVRLGRLVPASTFMARLFDRKGRLDQSYVRKSIVTSGDVAAATYAKAGAPDVAIEFELARGADGRLLIAGVRNYPQFRAALIDSELVEELP